MCVKSLLSANITNCAFSPCVQDLGTHADPKTLALALLRAADLPLLAGEPQAPFQIAKQREPTKHCKIASWSTPHAALVAKLSSAMALVNMQGRAPDSQLAQLLLKLPFGHAPLQQQQQLSSSSNNNSNSPCLPVLHAALQTAMHSSPGSMEAKPALALLRVLAVEKLAGMVAPPLSSPSSCSISNAHARTSSKEGRISAEDAGSPAHPPAASPVDPLPSLLAVLGDHLLANLHQLTADKRQLHHVLLSYAQLGFVHTPLMHSVCEAIAQQLHSTTAAGSHTRRSSSSTSDSSSSCNGQQDSSRARPAWLLSDIARVLDACSNLGFRNLNLLREASAAVQQQWNGRWLVAKQRPWSSATPVGIYMAKSAVWPSQLFASPYVEFPRESRFWLQGWSVVCTCAGVSVCMYVLVTCV